MRISDGLPGFSYADADGKFSGIDVDVCRGVAAAVFGDDTKVKYTPLTAKERFTALQSGEVDLLSRNTTRTSSRDAGMGMAFTGVTYYDGIGFLTHDKAAKSAKELMALPSVFRRVLIPNSTLPTISRQTI